MRKNHNPNNVIVQWLVFVPRAAMARAAAQYVFAALLALLSAQAAPSRHLESPAKIVWCAETEQHAAEQLRPVRVAPRERLAAIEYESRVIVSPDAPVLFQRPPPVLSLFA